eukprot:103960_1
MGNEKSKTTHIVNKQPFDNVDMQLNTFSRLINMGFHEDISLTASKMYPNNINDAINYITNIETTTADKNARQIHNKNNTKNKHTNIVSIVQQQHSDMTNITTTTNSIKKHESKQTLSTDDENSTTHSNSGSLNESEEDESKRKVSIHWSDEEDNDID